MLYMLLHEWWATLVFDIKYKKIIFVVILQPLRPKHYAVLCSVQNEKNADCTKQQEIKNLNETIRVQHFDIYNLLLELQGKADVILSLWNTLNSYQQQNEELKDRVA